MSETNSVTEALDESVSTPKGHGVSNPKEVPAEKLQDVINGNSNEDENVSNSGDEDKVNVADLNEDEINPGPAESNPIDQVVVTQIAEEGHF